jgi:hypothetical protein
LIYPIQMVTSHSFWWVYQRIYDPFIDDQIFFS